MDNPFWDLPEIRDKQQLLLVKLTQQCEVLEKLCASIEKLADLVEAVCREK